MSNAWNDELEKEFKETIKHYFDEKISAALAENDYRVVGNNLASLLKNSEEDIVKIITPRAVKKWASADTLPLWEQFLNNEHMVLELREIGKSIANSMRPLAGNNFAMWVTRVLNRAFEAENIPLQAATSGAAKQALNRTINDFAKNNQGFKPDIDIVVVKTATMDVVAIISAKTTLAERVMQTISWNNYLQTLPASIQAVKLYLVTAWETFESESANRERVQQLDGVYVCNLDVQEHGNIKKFSSIIADLKALL